MPVCTSGEVSIMIKRITKTFSREELFFIRDSNNCFSFIQPRIENTKEYTWYVSLHPGTYTIQMIDTYGDYWSNGSNVTIMREGFTIGAFRCIGKYKEETFTI